LNTDGQAYFPEWIKKTATILRNFEGFVSISQFDLPKEEKKCHMLLEFENEQLLKC
jgi:hypothetical protein